jgi:hypothetical protein
MFVDFHQTYNFTCRTRLINTLYEFGVQDKLFGLVKASMISNTDFVKLQEISGRPFDIKSSSKASGWAVPYIV